ncbi:NAD(P)-dependent oxidoreductase [Ruegeria sp. HKCCD8929]|uniref:NAD(P)-dependent oxidoreductase n=1 Tax=Ruegeria sp. HKCCD8929 TaxID=2683006 RepID=UPI0014884D8D|nr:NAD(P)-dependent oxidoreductase [Ruegeria sp. HKCCD8929]
MSDAIKPLVGFIGLGLMGCGMARNILAAGYSLLVAANNSRSVLDELIEKGAKEARSPKELAANADVVFLCLPSSKQVETVVKGDSGLLAGAKPGTIIVDCSTADPTSTQDLYDLSKAQGVEFADAPLGGTPTQADEGTLTALVGADQGTFDRIEPVCAAWASSVIHLGPVTTGHKMKLLNNFLSLTYGALYAEALAIAKKTGLNAQTFDSVIRGSRMDCGFYQTYMQYVLNGEEAHKFSLANAHKDLTYLNAMADAAGVATHIGCAVKNIYTHALNQGKGEAFCPRLSEIVAEANDA